MNKNLLVLILLTVISGTSLYYLNNQTEVAEETTLQAITPRSFFRGPETYGLTDSLDEFVSQVLSYGIKYTSTLDELAEGDGTKSTSNTVQINAQCYVQSKFLEADNLLEVSVQYTSIDKILTGTDYTTENLSSNNEQEDLKLAPVEIEEQVELEDFYDPEVETNINQKQDYFYLVIIDIDSGKIQKVERENAYDEDTTLTWITQQLINDIFPDSRVESYQTPQLEKDNLGEVLVEYTQSDLGGEYAYLTRDYDSNDLVNPIVTNVQNPDIDYDRDVIIEYGTGIVTGGTSDFDIEMGNKQLDLQQSDDEGEDQQVIFGENMNGNVNQEFWKIELSDETFLEDVGLAMLKYRKEADLVNVFLYNYDQAVILYGTGEAEQEMEIVDIDSPDEEEIIEVTGADVEGQTNYQLQNLLSQGLSMSPPVQQDEEEFVLSDGADQIYRQSTLASLKIFGSRLKVDFTYQGNAVQSNVNVAAKVNSHVIKKIVNINFNACKSQQKSIDYDSQDVTLFTAVFPVFGIITINVSVRTRIQYGLEYSTAGIAGQCTMNVQPWFRTALYADGKASLAGIISAGIYAQGTFLDANLQFGASVNQAEFNAQLVGNFKAATTEVGLVYSKLKCDIKNVLGEGQEEEQEQQEQKVITPQELEYRRNLGLRKRIKKASRKVTHVVKKAANVVNKTVNQVTNVVNKAVNVANKVVDVVTHPDQAIKKLEQKAIKVVQKAVKKTVTKVINGVEQKFTQVVKEAKKVVKTVQDVAKVVQNITKICSLQKGYKQLAKSNSREYKKVMFDFTVSY